MLQYLCHSIFCLIIICDSSIAQEKELKDFYFIISEVDSLNATEVEVTTESLLGDSSVTFGLIKSILVFTVKVLFEEDGAMVVTMAIMLMM